MTHDEEECCIRIAELEEENEHLRRAAGGLGQLAERLNVELQKERRLGAERRQPTRPTPERRGAATQRE